MKTRFNICVIIVASVFQPSIVHGACASMFVDTMDDLRKAIKTATPGSVIEVADGKYELVRDLELKRLKGTPEQAVTIRAQHPLQVEFTGDSVVKLRDSEYFVLQGFRFTLKADVHGKSGALSVRNCHHCRITGNEFELDEYNTGEGNQTWLTLDGEVSAYNRIDHNRFANKNRAGHYIFVTGEGNYVSQYDVIERNHFRDLAYGNDENGFETIRVGESRIGNAGGKSFTTIRENLFERCQGEDEIVSFKVGGCSFIGNTVLNCHGSVVFRDGNDAVFSQNIVLNNYGSLPFDAYRAGGVRFYGSGHRVFNNYFEGLNGTSMKAPLALMHGAPAGSGALGVADGLPATTCEIVHNTWVRCAQLRLGHASKKRPLPPQDCVFANNIVCETEDSRLVTLYEAEGIACRGNILHANSGKESGVENLGLTEAEFRVVDPQLEKREELYRLTARSPAVNSATTYATNFAQDDVADDLDGQLRDDRPDVGADEFSAEGSAFRMPLKAADVGPPR